MNLDDFTNGHPLTVIDAGSDAYFNPRIVIRHGNRTVVIDPLGFDDHLSVDVRSFINGEQVTSGVFGMTTGKLWELGDTGTRSHGWHSAPLVTILLGEQS